MWRNISLVGTENVIGRMSLELCQGYPTSYSIPVAYEEVERGEGSLAFKCGSLNDYDAQYIMLSLAVFIL